MGAISSMSAVLIRVARSDWWESRRMVSVIWVFLSVFALTLRSAFAGAVVLLAIIGLPPSLEPVVRRYGSGYGRDQVSGLTVLVVFHKLRVPGDEDPGQIAGSE